VATPLKELRLGVAWDWLELHDWPGQTWAIAGYASLQATEKLSFHARAEYLKDSSQILFSAPTDQVLDLTATVQYDLWKNVITRVEFRWDHSLNDTAAFGGTIQGVPQAVNAFMLGANIIYRF
jgi:predicted porin